MSSLPKLDVHVTKRTELMHCIQKKVEASPPSAGGYQKVGKLTLQIRLPVNNVKEPTKECSTTTDALVDNLHSTEGFWPFFPGKRMQDYRMLSRSGSVKKVSCSAFHHESVRKRCSKLEGSGITDRMYAYMDMKRSLSLPKIPTVVATNAKLFDGTLDASVHYKPRRKELSPGKSQIITKKKVPLTVPTREKYSMPLYNADLAKGEEIKFDLFKENKHKTRISTYRSKSHTHSPLRRKSEVTKRKKTLKENGYYFNNFAIRANSSRNYESVSHFPISHLLSLKECNNPTNNVPRIIPEEGNSQTKSIPAKEPAVTEKPRDSVWTLVMERKERITNMLKSKRFLDRLKICTHDLDKLARIKIRAPSYTPCYNV